MNKLLTQKTAKRNSIVSPYTLLEEIGQGSYGTVYKAHHQERSDETVALKIIEDTGNLDKVLIEPDLLSGLNNPYIVKLKDYFLNPAGNLVLVTEYIKGISLKDCLQQRGRLPEIEVKLFLTQMAKALVEAHSHNVIHQDIKLSNILVAGKNPHLRFVLVDFGVSRIAEGIQTVKRVAGTYHYMAPEQLRGRPCDQSDLWALGVCAYALLTGNLPFTGKDDELLQKILFSFPEAPSNIVPGIDPELESIIFHLLEKELTNRTDSASTLLNELKASPKSQLSFVGKTKEFLSKKDTESIVTWEQKDTAELQKSWRWFWIFAVLVCAIDGIVAPAISLGGLVLFYMGQQKRNLGQTVGGIFLLIVGFITSSIFSAIVNPIVDVIVYSFASREEAREISYAIYLGLPYIGLPFTIIMAHYLAETRRLQEKLVIHKTLKQSAKNTKEVIEIVKNFVDIRPENVNIRQKYIELLLLDNQLAESIVEAKLGLEIDPYNFGINLLLAKGYFKIGLYDECIQVCNGYLAVCPYSFEFTEIKEECLLKLII